MPRTFIAVKIPALPELRPVLTALSALGKALKVEPLENLHLTVKFLGETPEDQLEAVAERLRAAAEHEPAFTLKLTGLGTFRNIRRPSVVWAAIEPADPLVRLSRTLNESLAELGFEPEARAYRPHLTLARVRFRPPAELYELLREHAATEFGTVEIRSVELFRSELRPSGACYTVLHSVPLLM